MKKNRYIGYVMTYGCYYLGLALFSSLISVYMMSMGFSAAQVSAAVSSASVLTILIQPVIGVIQDRSDSKKVTVFLLALSALTGFGFVFQTKFLMVLFLYAATMTLVNCTNPYIEKLATYSEFSYSSVRIWGSIGYAAGSKIAGVVYDCISPKAVYCAFVIFIILGCVGVCLVKRMPVTKKAGSANEYRRELLKNGRFLAYMFIAAVFYATTNLNSTYLPVLYKSEGIRVNSISTVLFAGTMMEIPVILLFSKYIDRFSVKTLLTISFVSLVIQFGVYAFIPFTQVKMLATVLLKSSATMSFIMINLKAVAKMVDEAYQMSALMLVSSVSKNLITIIMQNIGGRIVDAFSVGALFVSLFAMSAAGLILVFVVNTDGSKAEEEI